MTSESKGWFCYIVECADRSYYVGVATDLQEREEEHNTGQGARHTRLRRPVRLVWFRSCAGYAQARALEAILDRKDPGGRNFAAELALGTNPACRLIPKSREIKKRLGQAHVALGDNASLGGVVESAIHLDIILLRPTVTLDGAVVLDAGTPVFAQEGR